ncbi:hypothetical protein TWF225_001985 [Orbilia oligospora]|uniref:Coatomer subunit delta n=1 Tax=Orbilia oligospora TaxID=2813651 RepID=A0A7C8KFB8_ORBOL|nr:hypothetical protein TWF225_001985 [Orbilia oligospora]KAF3165058.1 hypothetical protein TWF751_009427 [Orbilia oligospora]KAF3239673.1 hypothetical protein TWF217_001225 [Orbilia oligospora]KAF3261277.1 hypothetical protein TWF128_003064 [Orbilia oligospora]KAF3281785.1 hypothetical protein TWF132_011107 [Orbilia oligospora]
MVVLAASITTRSGKPVFSRQFREMPRSRIEALLAAFPKLTDSSTQHTTVEGDTVRYVYQPLEESFYMVLITNKQSNILQDIDSLHLFAQVVGNVCKTLDEREILKNVFELMGAFDEVVSLGYRENLSLGQIKTFLEMESHEERIQEIIARNKEFEASEERKRKAKQLELQRKEAQKSGRPTGLGNTPRSSGYPSYQPVTQASPAATSTYDSYEAEKNKAFKSAAPKGKGMQLGRKSNTSSMFDRVKADLGPDAESASLISHQAPAPVEASPRASMQSGGDGISIAIKETISAELTRDGDLKSFEVKGDMMLRVNDASLAKIKIDTVADATDGTQFRTHPNVDRTLFSNSNALQLKDPSKPFPSNGQALPVLRWRLVGKASDDHLLPIRFTIWVNRGSGDNYTITAEYEVQAQEPLNDVVVTIPYAGSQPSVSSFDADYTVSGSELIWRIGTVDSDNGSGSLEFEAEADDDSNFFPMSVSFWKSKPSVNVDATNITLLEMGESVDYVKTVEAKAEKYLIVS